MHITIHVLPINQRVNINEDARQVGFEYFSEALALAVVNHSLVRYFLISNPQYFKAVYAVLEDKDKFAIAKYSLSMRDLISDLGLEVPRYIDPKTKPQK